MSRVLRFVPASALAMSMAACSSPTSRSATGDPAADMAAITNVRAAFSESMGAGDAARLASLYTADAVLMNENEPAVVGRDAILAAHQKTLNAYFPMLALMPDETKVI